MGTIKSNDSTLKMRVKNRKIDKEWIWLYETIGFDLLKDIDNTLQNENSRKQFVELLKPVDENRIRYSEVLDKVKVSVRYLKEQVNNFDISIYFEYKDYILEFVYIMDIHDDDATYKDYCLEHIYKLPESFKLKIMLLGIEELTYSQLTQLVERYSPTIDLGENTWILYYLQERN